MRLKKFYTSREVAAMTGLSARQLQWWDSRRLFTAARATQRTEAGGFTERRYTPLDVLELQVLADLRRGSIPRLRRLLTALRRVRRPALRSDRRGWPDDALSGRRSALRQNPGRTVLQLDAPAQPLLVVGEELSLRPLTATSAGAGRRSA